MEQSQRENPLRKDKNADQNDDSDRDSSVGDNYA